MSGFLTFNGRSVDDSEIHVAGERAPRRGHHDLAGCGAGGADAGHVCILKDWEIGGGNGVKGDAGCAGEVLPQDLPGLTYFTRRADESDERAQSHVETINCSVAVKACTPGGAIERTICVL